MATLKQDIADGKVADEREKLEGFEKPITSKLEKKAQTDFQTQLQRLKAEGKAK